METAKTSYTILSDLQQPPDNDANDCPLHGSSASVDMKAIEPDLVEAKALCRRREGSRTILVALNSNTPDKSPKGYVDEPLLPLIILINNHQDYVTTSSCSGRICTYLEGLDESQQATVAAVDSTQYTGIDGFEEEDPQVSRGYEENTSLAAIEAAKRAKGGQWLYVSHDPVVFPSQQKDSNDQHWIVEMLFGPEAHRVVLMEDK
ncbi:hypothetical protein BGZ58_001346 [Dissophora ornata]|nr:hypothetical protein BGZ58_001346 [Dissophora ornata]